MASRYNEGKAIDAVLRHLEARAGAKRQYDGRSPDDQHDSNPLRRVDYVCTIGTTLHAFEHTGIEPFADQIQLEIHNGKLFEPITAQFDGRGDREFWELHVPVDASAGLAGEKIKVAQSALIRWIKENAGRLPVPALYSKYANSSLGESAADVPFPFSLHRGSLDNAHFPKDSPLCGRFTVKYIVSADFENSRIDRLKKSCEDKFPKLAEWKRDGAHTVLILEENDLALTNHQRVADAFAEAEKAFPDAADEVFLVSTVAKDTWWVTCLRREGKSYYDDEERFHEIDPSNLAGLTRR